MSDNKGDTEPEENAEHKSTGARETTQRSQAVEDFLYAPPPRIAALKEFQVRAAKHMIMWPQTINASPCGSGKTLVSIAAIDALDLFPALIVCSKRVSLQWAGEFLRWLDKRVSVSVLDGRTVQSFEGEYLYTLAGDETVQVPVNDLSADVVIAPYSIVYGWAEALAPRGNRVLVIDELRVRSRRTYQYFACKYLAERVVRTKYFRHIYGLSADAVVNRPADLRGIFEVIGRKLPGGDWRTFANRYCNCQIKTRISRSGHIRRYYDYSGSSNLDHLHRQLRDLGMMFRLMEKDIMPEAPEKQRIMIPVTLSNAAEYARAESDLMGYIREIALLDRKFSAKLDAMSEEALRDACDRTGNRGRKMDVAVTGLPTSVEEMKAHLRQEHAGSVAYRAAKAHALARLTVLRRLTAVGKAQAFIGWLKDFFEENLDQKFIAFGHHKELQELIAQAFPGCASITGGQSTQDSDANKNRFQHDSDCHLIVVSQEAGGEGLNLSAAYHMGIAEYPWTAKTLNQMEGRAYLRLDNPHGIVAHYFVAPNTIDDHMRKILQRKQEMVSMIQDGRETDGFLSKPIDDELLSALTQTIHAE